MSAYPRPIYMRWRDHWSAAGGWTHADDIEDEGIELETVAYLIDETDGCYVITTTLGDVPGVSLGPAAILKCCVVELADLVPSTTKD